MTFFICFLCVDLKISGVCRETEQLSATETITQDLTVKEKRIDEPVLRNEGPGPYQGRRHYPRLFPRSPPVPDLLPDISNRFRTERTAPLGSGQR
jgi:hypothetical protein